MDGEFVLSEALGPVLNDRDWQQKPTGQTQQAIAKIVQGNRAYAKGLDEMRKRVGRVMSSLERFGGSTEEIATAILDNLQARDAAFADSRHLGNCLTTCR